MDLSIIYLIFITMADFGLAAQYQNNNNDIALAWSKAYPGPYSIYISDFVDGPWNLIKTTEVSAFVYSNASSKQYFFQVFSSKFKPNTGIQYSSNIISVSPSITSIVNDTGHFVRAKIELGQSFLSLTDDTLNSRITLSWRSVSNATYYGVYRRDSISGQYTHVGDTQGTSLNDSTPYIDSTPLYTYYVIPATSVLFGPQSNTKDFYLSGNIGIDPVLGPPFPPLQYSMSVTVPQPRLEWNVPDLGTGYPRLGGFTQDTGQQNRDLVYWYSDFSDISTATGSYTYGISNSGPKTSFVRAHNYIYAIFGDGSGSIGNQPADKVMLINEAGGGDLSSYIGGVVIIFQGGNPTGSQTAFYDANNPELITGFSVYRKGTPFTSSAGLPEGTLIANLPGTALSYSDSASLPIYYRLIGHTTYFDYPYNDVSLTSGFYTNYRLNRFGFAQSSNVLPALRASMADAIVGDTIYLYGGRVAGNSPQNTIWSANVATPDIVTNTGQTLPILVAGQRLLIISGTMYMYGGVTSSPPNTTVTNLILTASISNPTIWGIGGTMPKALVEPAVFVSDSKIWFIGGITTGITLNSASYTASVSSPLTLGFAGTSLAVQQLNVVQLDQKLIAYGGRANTGGAVSTFIYTASKSNPLSWFSSSTTIPGGSPNHALAIGNVHFQFGGDTGTSTPSAELFYFSASNPNVPVDWGATFNPNGNFSQNNLCYTKSDGTPFMVMYGGNAVGADSARNIICVGSISTFSTATPADTASYAEMPPWKRLISTFTTS